jgi:hypothetical protein
VCFGFVMGSKTGEKAEDPRMEEGVHALKVLHLGNRVPKLVRLLTPSNALMLEEESWNCFPYCKTVYRRFLFFPFFLFVIFLFSSHYFGKRFTLTVETMVLDDDRGEHINALGLSEAQLKLREIDYIDILEGCLLLLLHLSFLMLLFVVACGR